MTEISVIIPTFNRPDNLKIILETLSWQTCKNFEVIISDDGSEPATYDVIRRFSGNLDLKYMWQHDKPWNQPEAKNLGMKLAKGEIIFLSDDYVFYPPRCLELHVRRHQETKAPIMIFGGVQFHAELPLSRVVGYLRSTFPKGISPKRVHLVAQKNFSAKKREVYAVNGYDQDFCGHWGYDDEDFTLRLQRNGVKRIVAHDIPSLAIRSVPIRKKDLTFNKRLYDRKQILKSKGIEEIVCYNGLFDRR